MNRDEIAIITAAIEVEKDLKAGKTPAKIVGEVLWLTEGKQIGLGLRNDLENFFHFMDLVFKKVETRRQFELGKIFDEIEKEARKEEPDLLILTSKIEELKEYLRRLIGPSN